MVEVVNQPVPESPTNVQSNNPYVGLDRGLFLLRNSGDYKLGRIHAVRNVVYGPSASSSVLEFKVMLYKIMPVSPEDYATGFIPKAPDGTEWFDCLARGSVLDPITAEYWAVASYLKWYNTGGFKLTQEEKDRVDAQAKTFTKTMGSFMGMDEIELMTTFDAVAGQPLTRTSINLGVDYTRDNVAKHIDTDQLPTTAFDPVRIAMGLLKNL